MGEQGENQGKLPGVKTTGTTSGGNKRKKDGMNDFHPGTSGKIPTLTLITTLRSLSRTLSKTLI